ncbi:hypothetical protein W97_03221 [Coniosporium apollinis CBS 100218]|uniref:Elongator complex protein 2 n=1 Tax=Coniosporium apollinis (strain CBS 100218) TaxID=1168221 RepID=R7YQP4_CONA1|nr:uncharacterized protein W97_03221 [Coniosporium apollinis CBS 100218]EON63991.1 hypothetical protein W97_03221 [Coniosporium apollinis CBS 100218]
MAVVEPIYLSAGGNRHPAAADWNVDKPGLLAFGAGNNIALWDPLDEGFHGVQALLSGHTDIVNVVKFLPLKGVADSLILSGSADKSLRIWSRAADISTGWLEVKTITDHQSSINCVAVLHDSGVFVSGSADAKVNVWKVEHDENSEGIEVRLLQTISLTPKYFPLAVSLAQLNESSIALAVAGTKASIQIYISEADIFKLAATLTGHEGWIRSLSFVREASDDGADLLLASASQDKYIRLWRFHQGEELPAISSATSDPSLGAFGKSLSNKAHRFEAQDQKYSITFEALLLGHEDWIYSARWRRHRDRLQLLSASADSSLAMWEPDTTSGVWICVTRLGEISTQKGATTATGSTGGFWIGLWSPSGDSVVSLGRTGSWRLWNYQPEEDRWTQSVAISGHVKDVKGVAWAKDGSYLLSTSSDQTTRLHAEWLHEDKRSWHEFSRPQIHGYDLNCIDSIGTSRFISGADEKLLRVFDEPNAVASLLDRCCGIRNESVAALPDAANIPVLGLSNKAIHAVDENEAYANGQAEDQDTLDPAAVVSKSALDIDYPPLEDHLARHMLWPEVEKLYGHGYEISTVATSNDGGLVATACKASSVDHAVIRLYETKEWREIKPPLTAHSLTVTGLAFSDDGQYLLSVGRDRQWTLFTRNGAASRDYKLFAFNPKGHARMILGCSWAPRAASRVFATAGRDKLVKIWRFENTDVACVVTIPATSPVTAINFLSQLSNEEVIIAYGTETGDISIRVLEGKGLTTRYAFNMDQFLLPSKGVNQLVWRPQHPDRNVENINVSAEPQRKRHYLAVASEDSSVRLFALLLPDPA